jgi:hypothetical protein
LRNGATGASDGAQLLLGNSQNFTNAYFRLNGGANTAQAGASSLNIGVTESSPVAFYTNNTERMRITNAGNVGIGTSSPGATLDVKVQSGTNIYRATDSSNQYRWRVDQNFEMFLTNAAGTDICEIGQDNVFFNQGNVGIGTTSPAVKLDILGDNNQIYLQTNGSFASIYPFHSSVNTGAIFWQSTGTMWIEGRTATGNIIFGTGGTQLERARITAGGYFKASNDGVYRSSTGAFHEMKTSGTGPALIVGNTNASANSDIFAVTADRNTSNNTFSAIVYYNDGAGAHRFIVADSGNVTNTNNSYGQIASERRFKQDIVDAASQWDDIKNIRLRKFRYIKDVEQFGDEAVTQLGVIIDEMEQVSPGLVFESPNYEMQEVPVLDEDGNKTGENTTERVQVGTVKGWKSSILYLKSVKALQEAMARIESLETSNAELMARIDVIES